MISKDEFIDELIEATKTINQASSVEGEDELVDYVCREITDRLSLYLNLPKPEVFDERLVRIGARLSSGVFTQTKSNIAGISADTDIKSLSDNGQSITFGDSAKNYLATVSDGELFSGCAELLKPYRRIHVVSRFC